MATLKLVLRRDKQKADGTAPIYLRITQNRRSRFINAGIAVEPKHWNDAKLEVRKTHPQYRVLNDELTRLVADAQATALGLKRVGKGDVSALAIKKEIEGEGATSFFPFAQQHAEEWLARGKYWEWRKVNVLIGKLRDYHGDGLTFADLDRQFLVEFDRYMRERLGNKPNTRGKNLQILRRILKRAIQAGLFTQAKDPFYDFSIASSPTTKEKLTIQEVKAMGALDLSGDRWLDVSRDAFLFSFYCAGVRFGDLCRLRWGDVEDGHLTYVMAKTKKQKRVKMPEQARAILKKYYAAGVEDNSLVFPILEPGRDYSDDVFARKRISSKNVIVNRHLKTLAGLIGTSVNVSFHVSRHSFADYARTSGKDLYAISKALGHSKLQTTQTYLRTFDEEAVDGLMDDLFGGSYDEKREVRSE